MGVVVTMNTVRSAGAVNSGNGLTAYTVHSIHTQYTAVHSSMYYGSTVVPTTTYYSVVSSK